jgi:hypothetical protein
LPPFKSVKMKKLFSIASVLILSVTVLVIHSCKTSGAASGNVLKFNLEKAKTYDYEIVWDMDQKISDQDTKISLGGIYSVEVIEEKDGIKKLTGMYKSFKLYMKMAGLEMDIDSEKPVEPIDQAQLKQNPMGIMSRIFSAIKGKSFSMQVDEEGKVLSVTGFDQIINGMVDSTGADENAKLQIRASLRDQFNEQAVKDQFAQIFTIFPNKKVKVGDNWEKHLQTGGKVPAKFLTVYTVKQIEGDHVTLNAKSNISSVGGEMLVTGDQTGTLLVDSKTGLVLNAEFDQLMDTKVQGFDVKITGKGKIIGKEK